MTTYRIGYIIGSIADTSINRRLALALERLAPEADLELHEIPITQLPFYNYELDYPTAKPAATGASFREAIKAADGILIVTPEYNRSVPGVLKNALDWASRPKGEAAMTDKPSYVVGASIGSIGTAVAQQHLRSILSFLASPELAQPEVYLRSTPDLLDEQGNITEASTREFLIKALRAFHDHVARYQA